MFDFGKFEWSRTLVAGLGALVLSTTMIAAAAAPVDAAQPCIVVPADIGADQMVCSHA